MTANANPEPFNISDGIVIRYVKRNVAGSGEQLSLQTTLGDGRHDDASDHPKKTVPGVGPSDREREPAKASKCAWNVVVAILCRTQVDTGKKMDNWNDNVNHVCGAYP